MLDNEILFLKN